MYALSYHTCLECDVLRGSLSNDKLLERLHFEASPQDALHCRHAGIIPALNCPRLHKVGQLTLGKQRVHKVQPAKEAPERVGRLID